MRILTFPSLLLVGLFFWGPLSLLFYLGFLSADHLVFDDAYLLYVIRFTYGQAFLSASLSLLVGFVAAFLIQELRIKGGQFLWRFGLLCSSLPPLIVSLGILGSWGQFVVPFGWFGILFGHVFLNFSIPMRLVGTSLKERDRLSEKMALSLGASRSRVFWSLTLFSLRPSLISSWILAFLYSSTSLFILMFLGGSPRFTSLEVSLYEAIKWNLDMGKAVQIGAFQALVGGSLFYAYLFCQKRQKREGVQFGEASIFSFRSPNIKYFTSSVWWLFFLGLVFFPLGALMADGLLVMGKLREINLLRDLLTSCLIAILVAAVSLMVTYPALHYFYQLKAGKERSVFMWFLSAPQFFSPLVVALSLSLFFPNLKGSSLGALICVILAQTVFVIPLIHIPLRESFLRLSQEKVWAAQSLGANSVQRFLRIELPFMRRSIFFSFLLAVGYSMGEVVTFLMFNPPGIKTLALNIFVSMSRYRFQEAHISTLFLILSIATVLGLASYLEIRNE